MNEKYCASLELAKRLRELGFPQNTDFYWAHVKIVNSLEEYDGIFHGQIRPGEPMEFLCSAPHVGELGEWLPTVFEYGLISKDIIYLEIGKKIKDDNWFVRYVDGQNKYVHCSSEGDTEAEARAKMLIYLVENNLLDPKTL